MDIDDIHFDDPDLDDEIDNHLSKMSTILVRLLSSSVMIFQKGEMVIGGMHLSRSERLHLSSRHFGQARSLQLRVLRKLSLRLIREAFVNGAKLFDLAHSERVWIMKSSPSMQDSLIEVLAFARVNQKSFIFF
ncbi:hypothetical protein Adt_14839 [Abeliophyllum distichum]|uniref:Uncharacterized protein n=1 Tax=Abeliophyllum distichum TaxID=126358 RepID=A0ABD1U0R3_9LAMI